MAWPSPQGHGTHFCVCGTKPNIKTEFKIQKNKIKKKTKTQKKMKLKTKI